jgi:hypothetical protein
MPIPIPLRMLVSPPFSRDFIIILVLSSTIYNGQFRFESSFKNSTRVPTPIPLRMVVSTPLLSNEKDEMKCHAMPEPHLDNNNQQPTYYQFPCFTLGSFMFYLSQESNSTSIGRLDALGFDSLANPRPGRSPTLQNETTISQAFYKTTSTDRVPEGQGDPRSPPCPVGPYGLPNTPYYQNAGPRPLPCIYRY